ncbi:ParB/RepB/Spo0J family partition protein [Pseudoroseomonas sp. WGS1072]|uniref:ParB/RepB/Spo0J family partition protein n=1 Tax=Roseomonas sp. WGS1072 TaxID=3366816 RepID=UPI003BF136E1
MELRIVDPRLLQANPNNPRRTAAGKEMDDLLVASVKAVGLVHPPLVRPAGDSLEIIAGHRRVASAIEAGLEEIHVEVVQHADGCDDMRAYVENFARAPMAAPDRWQHINRLLEMGWTEQAIAETLTLPVREVRKAQLLGKIHPDIFAYIAGSGDMPSPSYWKTIALAAPKDQAAAWKRHKPKGRKSGGVNWLELHRTLDRRRIAQRLACFDAELARAHGVTWSEDLFAEPEDAIHTTNVGGFMGAQLEWLTSHHIPALQERGYSAVLLEADHYGTAELPKGAHREYGLDPEKAPKTVCRGFYLSHSGEIGCTLYRMPQKLPGKGKGGAKAAMTAKRPRISKVGDQLVGSMRTTALGEVLRGGPVEDDQLLALLVLAFSARNVRVASHEAGFRAEQRLAARVLRQADAGLELASLDEIRAAAREMLAHVLNCDVSFHSGSGLAGRIAGALLGADHRLPHMATEEFLGCLSKPELERAAAAVNILPRQTGKATRAAMVEQLKPGEGGRSWRWEGAGFAPSLAELAQFGAAWDGPDDGDSGEPPAASGEDEPPEDLPDEEEYRQAA